MFSHQTIFTKPDARRRRQLQNLLRRQEWIIDGLTAKKTRNLSRAISAWARGAERASPVPSILKIDISPQCNLRCTICVHAEPQGREELERQAFRGRRMELSDFKRIVDQSKGRSCAVSLYYLGDPLAHPDLVGFCEAARSAQLNVHLTTNFSFDLPQRKLKQLASSGLTHLTVSLDGFTQAAYERTRVGGSVELVKRNLRTLMETRRRSGQVYPKVEVQFIKFQHNIEELPQVRAFADEIGVDRLTDFWGDAHNYVDLGAEKYQTHEPWGRSPLTKCFWPYFSMLIKYSGEVIPCCTHRMEDQYREGRAARSFGNVLESGLEEIWGGAIYRGTRRLVRDPAAFGPAAKAHFCYACPRLYRTERDALWRSGREHAVSRAPHPALTLLAG